MIIREAVPADATAIANIHLNSWRINYRGIMPDDYLQDLSIEEWVSTWNTTLVEEAGETFVYVVEDEAGIVVGFVSGGPSRSVELPFAGELYVIHVVNEHHKKGIGRRFVSVMANRLGEVGMRSMLLWVLSGNPAEGFYSRLGGKKVARREFELGGALPSEIGFGWEDTANLRESSITGAEA